MSAMEAGHYASREWLRLNGRPPEAIWEWRDLERVIVQGAAPYLQAEALREAAGALLITPDATAMSSEQWAAVLSSKARTASWLTARADALTAEGTGNGASGSVGSGEEGSA